MHFTLVELEVLRMMAFLKDDQGKFVHKAKPGLKGAAPKLVAAFRFRCPGSTDHLKDKTIDDRFNRFRLTVPVNDHEIVGLHSQVVNQVVESGTPITLTTSTGANNTSSVNDHEIVDQGVESSTPITPTTSTTGANSTSSVHHLNIVHDSTFTMTAEIFAVCSKLVGEGADLLDEDNEHVADVMRGCTNYQSARRAGVQRNLDAKVVLYNKNVVQCTALINKTMAGKKKLSNYNMDELKCLLAVLPEVDMLDVLCMCVDCCVCLF